MVLYSLSTIQNICYFYTSMFKHKNGSTNTTRYFQPSRSTYLWLIPMSVLQHPAVLWMQSSRMCDERTPKKLLSYVVFNYSWRFSCRTIHTTSAKYKWSQKFGEKIIKSFWTTDAWRLNQWVNTGCNKTKKSVQLRQLIWETGKEKHPLILHLAFSFFQVLSNEIFKEAWHKVFTCEV